MSRFYTKTGDVYRLTTTVSGGRTIEGYTLHSTGNKVSVQPVSEEIIALGGGSFYDTFTIYTPLSTDVQTTDKIRVDAVDYIIQGVQTRDYGSSRLNHKDCAAIKK